MSIVRVIKCDGNCGRLLTPRLHVQINRLSCGCDSCDRCLKTNERGEPICPKGHGFVYYLAIIAA